MGHLNVRTINKLARKNLVSSLPDVINKKKSICEICQKEKQVKTSFKDKLQTSSTGILDLLCMDLLGLIEPVSLSGKNIHY